MDRLHSTVPLSFPFAAGVALAEFAPLPSGSLQVSLFAVSATLLLLCSGLRCGRFMAMPCYFFLGVFCACLSSLPGCSASAPGFVRSGLDATENLIDSIPFAREGTGALLRALLTGQRDRLTGETVAAFRRSGASHILALSGMHLGIIYLLLEKASGLMGRGRKAYALRSILIILCCWYYALFTGASPSIIRACLFICMNEVLKHFPQRERNAVNIWSTALLIQLCITPAAIRSISFQLSYLAMLGIFTLYPVLDGIYPPGKGPVRKIWSSMAMSVSCQALTAPLVWLRFGTFPKYFLLTNLLALPITTLLMFCACTTLLLSAIGLCPETAVRATDFLASLLTGCLEIISRM